MHTELNFINLIAEASLLVQLVMLTLVLMSVVSWAMIFQRIKILAKAQSEVKQFEDRFWSGVDLAKLYNEVAAKTHGHAGLEAMFKAGFKEFSRLRNHDVSATDAILDGTHRSMRVTLSREVESLETNLSFLATIGSISPYIGLFGTVWGIMNSFMALGQVQQATLSMVAPGIAEALIATAMGLFAAIPAVIAYNRFTHRVEKIENSYANFMEEFSNILHRQAASINAAKAG